MAQMAYDPEMFFDVILTLLSGFDYGEGDRCYPTVFDGPKGIKKVIFASGDLVLLPGTIVTIVQRGCEIETKMDDFWVNTLMPVGSPSEWKSRVLEGSNEEKLLQILNKISELQREEKNHEKAVEDGVKKTNFKFRMDTILASRKFKKKGQKNSGK